MTDSVTNCKRRWFQFNLRTLLILMAIVAFGPGAWLAWEMRVARREIEAIDELRKLGAEIYVKPRKPLSAVMGDDFNYAVGIGLRNRNGLSDPKALAHIAELRETVWIDIQGTELNDDGLAHLSRLKCLKQLRLDETQVTDGGMKHLAKLEALEVLNLSDTQIGDAGLAHLADLKNLRELRLKGTRITDAGLQHLKNLKQLETLTISGTQATATAHAVLTSSLRELP
ncbi:MAG: Leucine-rich repeat (LRR) protein [Pirellulaceae bacterium]|jgi:Leucine-rich repeat (LRR) protein